MPAVLFLGAGASIQFGYPATKEFMSRLEKEKLGGVYDELVQYIRDISIGKIVDIEKVLIEIDDYLEFYNGLSSKDTYKSWLLLRNGGFVNNAAVHNRAKHLKELRDRINRIVYDTYWQNSADSSPVYEQLLGCLGSPPIDIFTTNYDLCVENALGDDSTRLSFCDGFLADRTAIRWKETNYSNQEIRFYKLHGSVDWKYGKDGSIWRIPEHDFTKHEDQCIIYPGFKGVPQKPPFDRIHKFLEDRLLEADRCVVIGFSFRDEYINSVFDRALSKNKELRLLHWNPEPPSRKFPEGRLDHLESPFVAEGMKKKLAKLQAFMFLAR